MRSYCEPVYSLELGVVYLSYFFVSGAFDVQAQGQDLAVVLERKEDTVVAVFLAEYFAVAGKIGGADPGGDCNCRGIGECFVVFSFAANEDCTAAVHSRIRA